jgi:VWFA-related protein
MPRHLTIALSLALTLGAELPARQQRPSPPVTFKVEVEYVEVDAVVTDKNGSVVHGLGRDDFEVYEDGKRQRIDLFSFVDLPVEHTGNRREKVPESDVQTNRGTETARVFVIVLDDLLTSPRSSVLVTAAARRFIQDHLAASDQAAVVYSSGRAEASQDFTINKRLLLSAVDKFVGGKDGGAPAMLNTVRNVAELLAGVRGRRKAMVLFSEGFPHYEAQAVLGDVQETLRAAARANVAIYGVHPGGLAARLKAGSAFDRMPPPANDALRRAQDSLRMLSEQTGGFAVVDSNAFAEGFDRIVRDQSAYYVIAYYPADGKRDGRSRRIDVKVNRPDVEVRARKGWAAPRGKPDAAVTLNAQSGTSPHLREALRSPLPQSGLPMTAQAAAFRSATGKSSVVLAVEFGGEGFTFADVGGGFGDSVELSVTAVSYTGKVRGGDRLTADLKIAEQTRQAVDRFGCRMLARFEVPPGRYQLRIGGRTSNADLVGTLYYDLEVPDFLEEPISLSGVVLTSARAALTPTWHADEPLKKVLPAPPTTVRDFRNDDTITVFTETYEKKGGPFHLVDVTTTVRSADDGRVVLTAEDTRPVAGTAAGRGNPGYTARVPLKAIPPGAYVLRVEAKSGLAGAKGAFREVPFGVRSVPAS